MPSRLIVFLISLLLVPTPGLIAQRLPPGKPVVIRPFALQLRPGAFPVSPRAMTVIDEGDHRWEGAAIGGVLGGIIGLSVRGSQCDDRETPAKETCPKSTLRWGLIGAALGAVAGGLIGSQIDK